MELKDKLHEYITYCILNERFKINKSETIPKLSLLKIHFIIIYGLRKNKELFKYFDDINIGLFGHYNSYFKEYLNNMALFKISDFQIVKSDDFDKHIFAILSSIPKEYSEYIDKSIEDIKTKDINILIDSSFDLVTRTKKLYSYKVFERYQISNGIFNTKMDINRFIEDRVL